MNNPEVTTAKAVRKASGKIETLPIISKVPTKGIGISSIVKVKKEDAKEADGSEVTSKQVNAAEGVLEDLECVRIAAWIPSLGLKEFNSEENSMEIGSNTTRE